MLSWFSTYPWTMAIGCAILLVAVAGVVYGVITKGGWKDRGFMERDGQKLHMANLPWAIYTEPNVPEMYIIILRSIMKELASNDINVFDSVLHSVTMPSNMKVLVAVDDNVRAGDTKHQYDKRTGEILTAFVSLAPNLILPLAEKVITHEMGHVMGLDHDEHVSSIMYPVVQDRPQNFTANDIERLRKAYG